MLIGHDEPWAAWRAALAGERMHHAWLLTGKAGLGKMRFAIAAAHELVGGGPAALQHPDILLLTYGPRTKEDEKKQDDGKAFELARSIRVGQIRDIQRRLTTRPTLGARRAVIIDPADDLERPAANALLKSLEEPPAGTYFLLVAHRLGRLLPTIRSRCRVLTFPSLGDDEIDAVLQRAAPQADEGARHAAIAASRGSPGAALEFLALDLGELHRTMCEIAE